jgi:hypothetical protein
MSAKSAVSGLEDLVHDAERVLAREARAHLADCGRDGDGIAVVDVDRAHGGVARFEQCVADRVMLIVRGAADQIGRSSAW